MPTILLIEDDEHVRAMFRLCLELEGHRVQEARDGAEGLRAYRRLPADLVVCDVFMPGQDGLAVIGELRREFPGARVVAVSGGVARLGGDFLALARRAGAAEALAKPLGPADLVGAVRRALAG